MNIKTQKYVRNPLYVDAVEVTEDNFRELAIWCHGDIANRDGTEINRIKDVVEVDPEKQFIRVRVDSPKNVRQTQAFLGDWILYTDRGYKVYTPGAFEANFTLVTEGSSN